MRALIRDAGKELMQQLLLRDSFLWRLPAQAQGIALTFDDGPNPEFTPALLDLLAREGALATFFLVGQNVERHPALARRIVDEGHAIGGHSYDHTEITALALPRLQADLDRCRRVIRDATGTDSNLFRPPRGVVNLKSMLAVDRFGYRLIHWSKTFADYRQDGTAPLVGRIDREGVARRDILLFHDHNRYTIEALKVMIPRWKADSLVSRPIWPAASPRATFA